MLKKLTLISLLLLCGTASAINSGDKPLINLGRATPTFNSFQTMAIGILGLGAGIAINSTVNRHKTKPGPCPPTPGPTPPPGEIIASNVVFGTPSIENLTITNSTSENISVTNVTLDSTIHNVTVGSLANCQSLSSGTCTIPLTAIANSYGSGNATITYSSSSTNATATSFVAVINTNIGTQHYIDLAPDHSSQFFKITNIGNFTWQFLDPSSSSFVLGASLTGVTPDFSDCTGKTMTPGTSCNIRFDTTASATPGDNTTLEIKGKNINTYTSNVTILGEVVVEVDTDPANINQSYRALKVRNTSTANLTGRITEVASDKSAKIHFCAHDDTSCPVKFRSTCELDQDIPAGNDCLIWLKASGDDQPIETDDVHVTVKGSTFTTNKHRNKLNATFTHVFHIDYSKNLYAGGEFTEAGGNPAEYIAKWDGGNWNPLGLGLGLEATDSVRALDIVAIIDSITAIK